MPEPEPVPVFVYILAEDAKRESTILRRATKLQSHTSFDSGALGQDPDSTVKVG